MTNEYNFEDDEEEEFEQVTANSKDDLPYLSQSSFNNNPVTMMSFDGTGMRYSNIRDLITQQ